MARPLRLGALSGEGYITIKMGGLFHFQKKSANSDKKPAPPEFADIDRASAPLTFAQRTIHVADVRKTRAFLASQALPLETKTTADLLMVRRNRARFSLKQFAAKTTIRVHRLRSSLRLQLGRATQAWIGIEPETQNRDFLEIRPIFTTCLRRWRLSVSRQ